MDGAVSEGPSVRPGDTLRATCGTSMGHVFAPLAARCVCGAVEAGVLEGVTRLEASVQALHDRLDTLERQWKARGSL